MSIVKRGFDWFFKPQVFVKQDFENFFAFKIYNRLWFIINIFINPLTLIVCWAIFPPNWYVPITFIGGFILNNIQKMICEIFYKF